MNSELWEKKAFLNVYFLCVSETSPMDCTFESGLCQWSQNQPGAVSWNRVQASDQVYSTAPSADVTTGTSKTNWLNIEAKPFSFSIEFSENGHSLYIFTTASQYGLGGQINGPLVDVMNDAHCVTFWYRMYGKVKMFITIILTIMINTTHCNVLLLFSCTVYLDGQFLAFKVLIPIRPIFDSFDVRSC